MYPAINFNSLNNTSLGLLLLVLQVLSTSYTAVSMLLKMKPSLSAVRASFDECTVCTHEYKEKFLKNSLLKMLVVCLCEAMPLLTSTLMYS